MLVRENCMNCVCVYDACHGNIRCTMKARDKGEPYQLRWQKSKVVSVQLRHVS